MIVVDSSIALQWLLPEPGAEIAESLIGRELAAPDIIYVEVANVLAKKIRAGDMTLEQAKEGMAILDANLSRVEPTRPLVPRALELSATLSHPVYDCTFLACALDLGVPMATRDKPFVDRASARGYVDQVQLFPFAEGQQ